MTGAQASSSSSVRPLLLRLAVAADVEPIRNLIDAAYSHYIARLGKEPGPMLEDYGALVGQGKVTVCTTGQPAAVTGLGEEQQDDWEILGVLVLVPQTAEGAMLLDNVAVAPRAQGQGVGRLLMSFAEDRARQEGLSTVKLYTHVLMTENIGLYGRLGYRETGRVSEKGFDRVYMEKRL
ncbi:hypothetical protein PpBr36_07122 [Pyricularia pennisetigena]|uniref:hypothetical protein n=1 Tax=Pyricularia pennisetigena TaxID=1578925 RepID=UPI00115038A8|nr:hypothetical protein PpBr36_07122 [Pyricularia pennisetigena]TLS26047.1 hypothetical protein PpBr36_07122 [Pyricularia pennisetigena]